MSTILSTNHIIFALCLWVTGSAEKTITIGTPGVSFHRTANYVVVRALERLGYKVTVEDKLPHRLQYPYFTSDDGPIDIFTGSDLPYNHAPWLWNYTDRFHVVGTVNEGTDIVLGAPSYAGISSVSEFVQSRNSFDTTILSLETANCPACVRLAKEMNTTVTELAPLDFIKAVKVKTDAKDKFVVSWYVPCWIVGELPELQMLRGDMAPYDHHSIGKTIIRRDRMHKLDTNALAVLSAVFVGNSAITEMDAAVNKHGMSPLAAADKWIAQNRAIFDSFFTHLPEPHSQAVSGGSSLV
jgi:glycine betaine/proline transport system substrate-binding protein